MYLDFHSIQLILKDSKWGIYSSFTYTDHLFTNIIIHCSTDPAYWGGRNWQTEDDDDIHNPESTDHSKDKTGSVFTVRGMINLGLLSLVIAALLMLLLVISFITWY